MTTTTCSLDGVVVGRLMKAAAAPEGKPWMWTLASVHHHEAHTPTHGHEATRAAAMAAFAKSWRQGIAPTGRLLFALTEYLFYSLHDWYFEILFIAAIIFHLAHIFIQDF